MSYSWYYAVGSERHGPVSETDLPALIASDTVKPETLVWRAGLDSWRSAALAGWFGEVATAAARSAAEQAGQTVPADIAPTAMRDGKRLVIPLKGAVLPLRCVKTNEPVEPAEARKVALYWCTPWVALAVLVNIIIVLLLYVFLRRKVEFALPLSRRARAQVRNTRIAIGVAIVAGFLGLGFAFGLASPGGPLIVASVLLLGALIFAAVKGNALRIVKLQGERVWLAGAAPEFLETLPPLTR